MKAKRERKEKMEDNCNLIRRDGTLEKNQNQFNFQLMSKLCDSVFICSMRSYHSCIVHCHGLLATKDDLPSVGVKEGLSCVLSRGI